MWLHTHAVKSCLKYHLYAHVDRSAVCVCVCARGHIPSPPNSTSRLLFPPVPSVPPPSQDLWLGGGNADFLRLRNSALAVPPLSSDPLAAPVGGGSGPVLRTGNETCREVLRLGGLSWCLAHLPAGGRRRRGHAKPPLSNLLSPNESLRRLYPLYGSRGGS